MKYYWIELDAYKSVENMKNYGVDYEIKFVMLLPKLISSTPIKLIAFKK